MQPCGLNKTITGSISDANMICVTLSLLETVRTAASAHSHIYDSTHAASLYLTTPS